MSSDEEDFAHYGTALEQIEEEEVVRKKPRSVEDQVAKDKYGRRRFHGAFTGGFSAGYFNSVGSQEGWAPSTFKSSRSRKAESQTIQKPEDFMDDEDTDEFGIAPKVLRLKEDYGDLDNTRAKKRNRFVGHDGPIPGQHVLETLLEPVKSSVGVKLLKKMGWKIGQGVGPRLTRKEKKAQQKEIKQRGLKIYGCSLPQSETNTKEISNISSNEDSDSEGEITFAPDDYDAYVVKAKDNFFGIGYSGLDRRPVLSNHINLFEPSFKVKDKSKKISIQGQGFGVGALEEEDEDIYSHEDMSQYDFSLDSKPTSSKKADKVMLAILSSNELIEGFVVAREVIRKKYFPPPKIPAGFQPVHSVRKSRFESQTDRYDLNRSDLTAKERAVILDEPMLTSASDNAENCNSSKTSLNVQSSSMSTQLTPSEPLKTIHDDKDSVRRQVDNVFKPFVSNPEKQKRYEQYLVLVKNGQKQKLSSLQSLSMTEWEREHERVEFEQAERLYRPISAVFSDRFISASQPDDATNILVEVQRSIDDQADMKEAAKRKMFGKLTTKVYTWSPSDLLCKRFNIRQPERCKGYSGSDGKQSEKRPKFSVFNFLEASTSNAFSAEDNKSVIAEKSADCRMNSSNGERKNIDTNTMQTIQNFSASISKQNPVKEIAEDNQKVNIDLTSDDNTNKEDLYKAIFLSSSDESDEENEDADKEVDKDNRNNETAPNSITLTKQPSGISVAETPVATSSVNVLRNTSPPRGIFANLDLDLINSRKSNSNVSETMPNKDIDNGKNESVEKAPHKEECDVTDHLLYGPRLPASCISSDNKSFSEKRKQKHIEPIIVSDSDSSDSNVQWVESDKLSKKKHKNKKKKHKEHKHKKSKKHKKHKS